MAGKMDSSQLSSQVTAIIEKLHGLFDDIGVPPHERKSREAEVSSDLAIGRNKSLTGYSYSQHFLKP